MYFIARVYYNLVNSLVVIFCVYIENHGKTWVQGSVLNEVVVMVLAFSFVGCSLKLTLVVRMRSSFDNNNYYHHLTLWHSKPDKNWRKSYNHVLKICMVKC